MSVRERLGVVAPLVRRPVDVQAGETYTEIGVRSYGRGLFIKQPIPGSALGNKRVFTVSSGDLVVSNIFAWEGAIAVAENEHDGLIGSHRFMTMRPRENVSAHYLQQYLLSEEGLAQVRRASPGSAGRNRTLSLRGLSELTIPVPPLSQQLEIVATLQNGGALVERLRERFDRVDPRELAAALPLLLGEQLLELRLPQVPVGELFDVVNDLVHPGDDPGPAEVFVGLQHIEPHTGRLLGAGTLGSQGGRKFRFAPGDVLYGYLRPYLNKVWVADRHGLCSVEQFVLRPRDGVAAEGLATCLRSSLVLTEAVNATNNLQLPRLRIAKLRAMEVPDVRRGEPPLTEGAALVSRVSALADARAEQTTLLAQVLPRLREELFSPLRE